MTRTIIQSKNESWGFYGTINRFEDPRAIDPNEAWRLAFEEINTAIGLGNEATRAFLDSRHGRHYADDVANELAASQRISLKDAIAAATDRWMVWTISNRISRASGIPAGLPYLIGFAANAEIEAELTA